MQRGLRLAATDERRRPQRLHLAIAADHKESLAVIFFAAAVVILGSPP
jgi:hypothetical protein